MIKLERTADHIEKTLREAFNPQELEVSDVSEAHRGHSGFQEGGESHFEVRITATILIKFLTLKLHLFLQIHQMVQLRTILGE